MLSFIASTGTPLLTIYVLLPVYHTICTLALSPNTKGYYHQKQKASLALSKQ